MTISSRFKEELRNRVTLSDIVSKRMKLQRAGREFKGCCPFHREKTPSFYVNDDKQFYHCFGCGAHGDVIGFIMQNDNLSFIEAIELLAAQAGMEVPKPSPQEREKARTVKTLYSLMEEATQFFEKQLQEPGGRVALGYLKERGLDQASLESFRIGFAPEDGQALRKYLTAQGYNDSQMDEVGLLRRSEYKPEPYIFFRNRIMFPVADRRGRIVAFGGRVLPEHLRPPERGDFKPPKFINSSETTLFHKGQTLYSQSRARLAAGDGDPVIVVEGYMDVMACVRAGFRGAVAPMGTALTEEQVIAVWRMYPPGEKVPILCFDGDNAGQSAAVRACQRILPLLQPDQSARIAFLPAGEDPDSLLKGQGKNAFKAVLEGALPLVDFIWNHHTSGRRFETPESQAGLAKALEDEADKIADRSVQHYYRKAFKDRLWQAFGGSRRGGGGRGNKKGYGRNSNGKGQRPAAPGLKVRRPAFADAGFRKQILLAAFLNHPAIFDVVEEQLGALSFGKERLDLLRQAAIHKLGSDPALDRVGLQTHLKEQGFAEELSLILSSRTYVHAGFARPDKDYDDVLTGWKAIWQEINAMTIQKEVEKAGRNLAQDLSEESVRKWQALHDVHKASDSGNPF